MIALTMLHKNLAAASCTLGTDMLDGEFCQTSNFWRKVDYIIMVGSAAVGDNAFKIFYGDKCVMESQAVVLATPATGVATMAFKQKVAGSALCPPGTKISVVWTDAPATQAISMVIAITEVPSRGRRRRRAYRGRRY